MRFDLNFAIAIIDNQICTYHYFQKRCPCYSVIIYFNSE